jgi:hypothetical protein
MLHFATYGDFRYSKSIERLKNQVSKLNIFNTITGFNENNIPKDFKKYLDVILKCKKGGGFWIWKPIILKLCMDAIKKDDILIYADAGCSINHTEKSIKRLNEYITMVKDINKPIIRFRLGDNCKEKYYTTSKILEMFNIDKNNDSILNTPQFIGGIIILRKCDITIKMIDTWVLTAINHPLLFTNFYNNYKKNDEFIDNRHDQSIFSIITKLNIDKIWDIPDETYKYNEEYPINASRIRLQ